MRLVSCFSFYLDLLGSPEKNIDTDENRQEFINKFQRLKQQVLDGIEQEKDNEKQQIIIARTIFTSDTTDEKKIIIGNWTLQCNGPKQLRILNVESAQVRLREEKKNKRKLSLT